MDEAVAAGGLTTVGGAVCRVGTLGLVTCPHCDEDESLLADTVEGVSTITGREFGCVRERDLAPRCPTGDRANGRQALESILDKSRGAQLSIQSMKVVWLCPDCDADLLARYLGSNVPLRLDALPVDPR